MSEDTVELSFEERHLWAGTVLAAAGVAVYLVIVGIRLTDAPASEVSWGWPLLWTVAIAGGTYGVVYGVLWRRAGGQRTDARDLEINRFGELTAKGLLDVTVLAVLIMLALGAEVFWVAQVLFLGSYVSSTIGSLAKLAAHRKGLPS
jgi:hypothetical protein